MERILLEVAKNEGYSEKARVEIFGSGLQDCSNFNSKILKGKISEGGRSLAVVIKIEIPCPEIKSKDKFSNEIIFFRNIHPQLQNYGDVPKVPRYLWSGEEDTGTIIILEDLSAEGYKPPVVDRVLDQKEVELALKELKKLHETSKTMKERNPDLFRLLTSELKEAFFFSSMFEGILTECVKNAIKATSRYLPPEYKEKMESFDYMKTKEWTKMQDKPSSVITHGDSWFSNFMFKYEDGRPTSVAILDFQMCRVASPLLDVSEFLLTSSLELPCPSPPEFSVGLVMALTIIPFFYGQADLQYALTPEKLITQENDVAFKRIAEIVKISVDVGLL